MQIKIRSKLILAISLLIVVLFSIVAILFIKEKKMEMADDIYLNALAFSRLTASKVADDYDLYLAENGFVLYNREMHSLFEQNDDVVTLKVISYFGELLYDFVDDHEKKYEGDPRMIDDDTLLSQVRAENISVRTLEGRTVYVKQDPEGGYIFVDEQEKRVDPLESGTLIDFIVVPGNEKYSVVYKLGYHNLEKRVSEMMRRITYMAIFGVLLGILMAIIMSSQITKPVCKLEDGVRKIAKGDLKTRVDIRTRDEIGFLGKAFNKMAQDLEASLEARLYKERVSHELKLAIEIQKQLIPTKEQTPHVEGIEVDAGIIPAEEMGGDMYDFLQYDKNRLLMYLGDVTGHGVPAGIVGSIASALFYGYAKKSDLKEMMIEVNDIMKVKTMPNMFMTLCLTEWSIEQKRLRYISAGHEQIIHYKAKEGKVDLTPAGGVALGMLPNIEKHMHVEEIDFQPGDFLVIYSDGIPEAWRSENENFGMERFIQTVQKYGTVKTSSEMKEGILKDVKDFTAGFKQMDDITLLVIKRI